MSRRRPEPAPVSSRVEILLGTHQVVVEGGEPMGATIDAALKLWRDTADVSVPGEPLGFTSPGTLVTDPAEQPLMPPEIPLPFHLIPAQETSDDRTI